jgi:eukaryotic-like serine/threonine-protein kinase
VALLSGERIGSYEIIGLLDGGGQGEVYRARDSRLSRDVALKVLRDDRLDAQQRARFEREAQTLAALNHPNIATLHGIEEWRGMHALVMELVEGQSLAVRLQRHPGHGIPIDEALRIAAQIALALEAAHERGIVHRDLKPGNVMIRPDETVKVLDFGLAKSSGHPAGATATTVALTATGPTVVGTAAYMSPEQARGAEVDRRTDVWAFGCVLYEMLTGVRPFDGATASDAIASVLTREADFEMLPPQIDASVRRLLRRCLKKDVRSRLRDIGDARLEIEDALTAPGTPSPDSSAAPAAHTQGQRWPARSVSIATGVLVLVAVAVALFARNALTPRESASEPPVPIRLSTMLPAGVSVTRGPGYTGSVALSPNGRTIVIAASDSEGQRLYRRTLDRLDPTPIAGTDGGSSPFFSPDGKWIGYFAYGRLKRMPAAGGAPVDVAAAPGYSGGASWGPDDRIVFSYGAGLHLQVVAAEGGAVEPLTTEMPGRQPNVLPDGRRVLFESAGAIYSYDRQTRASTKLIAGLGPRYSNGYLIFIRGTTLLAAPFNVEKASVGAAVAVTERVAVELPGSGGGRHYAISTTGTLVYVPAADAYQLVVAGAGVGERVLGQAQRVLENPRFSPDGRHVVVAARRSDDEGADLWLHDLETGTAARLTSHGGRAPVWRDNSTISYSHLGEQQGIFITGGDDRRDSTQLLPLKGFHWLVGWTPDRSTLLYGLMGGGNSSTILAYGNTQTRTVVEAGSIWGGRLSRDGKWLAYYMLNSGTFEVYVTPYPEGRTRWLVAEGTDPSWAPDGRELYYRSGPRLMAARLETAAGIKVLTRRIAVDPFLPPMYDDYDIHPDNRTLVFVRPVNPAQGREVTTVLGWLEQFRAPGR